MADDDLRALNAAVIPEKFSLTAKAKVEQDEANIRLSQEGFTNYSPTKKQEQNFTLPENKYTETPLTEKPLFSGLLPLMRDEDSEIGLAFSKGNKAKVHEGMLPHRTGNSASIYVKLKF